MAIMASARSFKVSCIGAPIRDKTGRIVATVTVASSIEMRHKPDWVRHLLSAVNAVSASLGWLAPDNRI